MVSLTSSLPIVSVVFGVAFAAIIFIFYLFIISGPSQLLTTAFGILDQGIASAGLAFNTLLSASTPMLTQGLEVGGALIEQAAFVADAVIAEVGTLVEQVIGTVGEFVAVEGALIASAVVTIGASVVSTTLNLTTMITVTGAELANAFLVAAQATSQFFLSMSVAGAQTAAMMIDMLVNATAQLFSTAFTSVAGVLGQLASIGLILFSGYLTVVSEYASIYISLGVAGVSIFTNLFKAFVSIFTDPTKFLQIIGNIVNKIGEEITKGFNTLVQAVPNAFKQVFSI